MAHVRDRYIEADFKRLLKYSPLVGVLGHRQVGKTTFIQGQGIRYVTFDKQEHLNEAEKDPGAFIQKYSRKLTAIDECQLVPALFPELKERVRVKGKPGQFVLSGSVRFSSKKAIRESLTGRILNLELLPMTVSELHGDPLPTTILKLSEMDDLESYCFNHAAQLKQKLALHPAIEKYLMQGGLPGICFVRDNKIRDKKIEDLTNLILDRDLRQIYSTNLSLEVLKKFLRYLARNEGMPLNHSQATREVRISDATQKSILYALEAIFVLRRVEISGGLKSKTYYFEDQAESQFFNKDKVRISALEGLVFRHLRAQCNYGLNETFEISQYVSKNKSRVPFSLSYKKKNVGIKVIEGDIPSPSEKQSANSYLRKTQNSKVLFVSTEVKDFDIIDSKTLLAPIYWLV